MVCMLKESKKADRHSVSFVDTGMCSLIFWIAFTLTLLFIIDTCISSTHEDPWLHFTDTGTASFDDLTLALLVTATATSEDLWLRYSGLHCLLIGLETVDFLCLQKLMMACLYCNTPMSADQQYYLLSEMDDEFIQNVFRDLNYHEISGEEIICEECFINQQRPIERIDEPEHFNCVRCRQLINANEQFYLLNEIVGEIRDILLADLNERELDQEHICEQCFDEAMQNINEPNQNVDAHHCVCCGRSLRQRRSYDLPEGPLNEHIAERIRPREILPGHRLCNPCYQVAHRRMGQVDEAVTYCTLPSYRRSPETTTTCFVRNCANNELIGVQSALRKKLLKIKKFLITRRAVVCREHIEVEDWDILDDMNYTNRFTSIQIEYMLAISTDTQGLEVNAFENFETLDDSTCKYWTGLTKQNVQTILNESPSLYERFTRYVITALAIYLIKLRTGDSNARIALLFRRSEYYISKTCSAVRTCLTQDFVPAHIGLNALPRPNLIRKNLLIPEGIFGDRNAGDNRQAITICDGTYIYTQSSSNYRHQRRTFSPNKHTNLVKTFLLVATDGHIVDIVGPYAATVSDATIMRNLFQNNNGAFRAYYREGDVFLLDRGFRDAVPFLNGLNYVCHMPESKQPGETQLSTLSANRSRLVTMCRWVVGVVNGRFKRDFKIFREEFFNLAAAHLMEDFNIVGTIINAFHRVIADRPDAAILLDRALARVNIPNVLADYVLTNNLNRRRNGFVRIDGDIPVLDMFPVMTMEQLIFFALGTYQIKQARSYYGEHIRENGLFQVEILRDIEPAYVPQIAGCEPLLIRGRLNSRYRNQKKHYCYLLIDPNGNNWEEKIKGYYCSCNVGKRTVGCCANVMTVVWYLGWARHQDDITTPAIALDNILL